MIMSSPVGPDGTTVALPATIPTLTLLPPSSDTESWSHSPSPEPSRRHRHPRHHRSRARTKKRSDGEQELATSPKRHREGAQDKGQKEKCEKKPPRQRNRLPSPSLSNIEGEEPVQDSPSKGLLLPPSRSSWSRSLSPGRRSRWSLRSLLRRDSDCDSCRSVLPLLSVALVSESTLAYFGTQSVKALFY